MKTYNLLLFTFLILYVSMALAQQTPQWTLPLYFESGDGQKDTVFICYDPYASGFSDVVDEEFSHIEGFIECDLSDFNAYVESTSPPLDNYLRKGTVKNEISSYTIIDFVGTGDFPLKIKWENPKLYSNELPTNFIEIPDRPRARIDFYPYVYCTDDCYFICTDSLYPEINSYMTFDCMDIFIDSVILLPESSYPLNGLAGFMVKIRPFDTYDTWWAGANNNLEESPNNITVYPNPTTNFTMVSGIPSEKVFHYLHYHTGKLVQEYITYSEASFKINTNNFKSGIYYLKSISTVGKVLSVKKVVIL